MSWAAALAWAFVGLALSAFFSGAETGIYCLSRLRLHLGTQQREPRALRMARVLDDEPGALTVTLLGTNVMNFITTSAVAYLLTNFAHLSSIETEICAVAFLTPIVFVFGEIVPKTLFQRHADTWMFRGSGLLALSATLFRATGAVWCLTRLSSLLARMTTPRHTSPHPAPAPKQRIAMLLQEALAGDAAGDAQSSLIERVVRLSDTPLHVAMVPRHQVVSISAQTDRPALIRMARRTRHARLPVSGRHRWHIIGLVKIDELLQTTDWKTVDERLEPAMTLNPNDTISAAITHMQEHRKQMAIVVDRTGRMVGIVTLRDLLREVLGELAAEP